MCFFEGPEGNGESTYDKVENAPHSYYLKAFQSLLQLN